MYGTKSLCPQVPAINPAGAPLDPASSTLVLAWYGSKRPRDGERMAEQTRRLGEEFGFRHAAASALMLCDEQPAPTLNVGGGDVLVLPVFMCEGLTLSRKIPAFVRDLHGVCDEQARIDVLPPVGIHIALAGLVAERAIERLDSTPLESELVLVAHGSNRDSGSARATCMLANRLRAMAIFASVRDAYLEADPDPRALIALAQRPCVVEGLFLTQGRHSTIDLSEKIGAPAPQAIGTDPRFARVLTAAVRDGVTVH